MLVHFWSDLRCGKTMSDLSRKHRLKQRATFDRPAKLKLRKELVNAQIRNSRLFEQTNYSFQI